MVALGILACSPPQEDPDASSRPGERWLVSTPEAEGIRAAPLDSLVADMEAGVYGLVDALLVVRHGKVIADHRFEQDYDSVDALAYPYVADYVPYETDARKEATTVEDLLTMRSGLHWVTEGGYDDAEHGTVLLEASDEWIRFVLDRTMDAEPGTVYEYNDGVSVLLGKILRQATGRRMDDWAQECLFEPMGSSPWASTSSTGRCPPTAKRTPRGASTEAHTTWPRIGYLFLREGEWDGEPILSREWVRASTAPIVPGTAPDGTGPGYGYQWWVPVHEHGESLIFAGNGYGGQFLFVVPAEDLVVVFNGWQHHEPAARSAWGALQERILPALIDPSREW